MAKFTEFSTDANGIATLVEMVYDASTLAAISTKWDNDLSTVWENRIGTHCVEHYRKFGEAPGRKGIESWWEEESSSNGHGPDYKIMGSILEQVLAREPIGNSKVGQDRAGRQINRVKVARLRDQLTDLLQRNKVNKAVEAVQAFRPADLGLGNASNPSTTWR